MCVKLIKKVQMFFVVLLILLFTYMSYQRDAIRAWDIACADDLANGKLYKNVFCPHTPIIYYLNYWIIFISGDLTPLTIKIFSFITTLILFVLSYIIFKKELKPDFNLKVIFLITFFSVFSYIQYIHDGVMYSIIALDLFLASIYLISYTKHPTNYILAGILISIGVMASHILLLTIFGLIVYFLLKRRIKQLILVILPVIITLLLFQLFTNFFQFVPAAYKESELNNLYSIFANDLSIVIQLIFGSGLYAIILYVMVFSFAIISFLMILLKHKRDYIIISFITFTLSLLLFLAPTDLYRHSVYAFPFFIISLCNLYSSLSGRKRTIMLTLLLLLLSFALINTIYHSVQNLLWEIYSYPSQLQHFPKLVFSEVQDVDYIHYGTISEAWHNKLNFINQRGPLLNHDSTFNESVAKLAQDIKLNKYQTLIVAHGFNELIRFNNSIVFSALALLGKIKETEEYFQISNDYCMLVSPFVVDECKTCRHKVTIIFRDYEACKKHKEFIRDYIMKNQDLINLLGYSD